MKTLFEAIDKWKECDAAITNAVDARNVAANEVARVLKAAGKLAERQRCRFVIGHDLYEVEPDCFAVEQYTVECERLDAIQADPLERSPT